MNYIDITDYLGNKLHDALCAKLVWQQSPQQLIKIYMLQIQLESDSLVLLKALQV
jgi:hypothetical protein